ncbi:MAG: TonB family protein [Terriglobia bacterium]
MLYQPLWLTDLAAYSLQVAAIVIVGSVLPPLLRLRVPKVRLIYWQVLLAVCLLLPLIEPWRPQLLPLDGRAGHVSISMGPVVAVGSGWPFSWAEAVWAVLLVGILFRAVWILLGLRRLRLYRTRANPFREKLAPINEAQRLTSVCSAIFLSGELKTPATFGFRFPAVLLPQRFFELPSSQQKAIACHELLHVVRRDWAWNMLEESILALLWFHPGLWWVVRNIRLSREQAVDAEVVRRTQSRSAYLSALLEMAQQDLGRGSVPAPLFLREGQLAERVALMVKEVSMSRFRLIVACLAAAAALMLTGGAAVWAFPLRTPTHAPDKVAIESGVPGGIKGGVEGGVAGGVQGRPAGPYKVIIHNGAPPHNVDVNKLKRVHVVVPHYPPEAKKAGIQGTVRLDVLINKIGHVTEVKLISGPPVFVKSAIDAVKQWRYAPSPLLPVRTRIEINYTLTDTPAKPAKHPSAQADPTGSEINGTLTLTTKKQGILTVATPGTGDQTYNFQGKDYKYAGKVYKVGKGVQGPVAVYSPDPPYTHEALKAKLSGDVVLSTVVSDEGRVISVKEVSKPLGKGLDESALKTIPTWKFKPGELDGKPVPVRMLIDVSFHIVGGKKPASST